MSNFERRSEIFKLPCGYIDEDGVLYDHVKVFEMLGEQEDKLVNRKKSKNGVLFDELISDCCKLIQSIGEEPDGDEKPLSTSQAINMRQGDRGACFIWIRQVTHGNLYDFGVQCPGCKKKINMELDLNKLDVTYMKEPTKSHYDVTLPRCGDTVTFKINTGHEEKSMDRMREQNPDDELTINTAVRVVSVNGSTVRPIEYLKKLTAQDRNFLRNEIKDKEGGIELRLKGIECRSCDQDFDAILPVQESFFLPESD